MNRPNRMSFWSLLSLAALTCGCVPDDRYRTILDRNDQMEQSNRSLKDENDRLRVTVDTLKLMNHQAEAKADVGIAKLAATEAAFNNLSDRMKDFVDKNIKVIPPGSEGMVEYDAANNVITIKDAGLFESGKADIRKDAERMLRHLAEGLKGEVAKGRRLRICGHTDDQPVVVNKEVYPTNWHLSGARALNVLLFLEQEGVSPDAMSFAGFGEHQPREANAAGHRGSKRNRRVEIAILGASEATSPDDSGS